ncbi:hypothetical protein NIES4074_61560 (plasmid) [Cylindrospermum sp. NIES-4074]|nr:hypothetical protein NIES4074_61560 [Cylindrospermum sp. NIES-4074]
MTLTRKNYGSQRRRGLLDKNEGIRLITIHKVTKLTWVYRGLTIPGELKYLQTGYTYSKALRILSQPENPRYKYEVWKDIGPNIALFDNPDDTRYNALRILAIRNSDKPASQFSSVALEETLAKSFGDILVAFQVIPNSPVLGLNECVHKLPNGKPPGGEIQLQIAGNTPIKNLKKKNGNTWETWDSSSGVWKTEESSPSHDEL